MQEIHACILKVGISVRAFFVAYFLRCVNVKFNVHQYLSILVNFLDKVQSHGVFARKNIH
jgi:hypothetical protein